MIESMARHSDAEQHHWTMSVNGSIISSPKPEPPNDISQHPSGALSFPTVTVTSDDDSDAVPNSAGPAPPANLNICYGY